MREETKRVIDNIIEQWCENKLSVSVSIDNEGYHTYTVSKEADKKTNTKSTKKQFSGQNEKVNENLVVCRIHVNPNTKEPLATITFKSPFSIDNDKESVYKYLERFLAVVRSKVRQINCWGIEVQLGMMALEEFEDKACVFMESKAELISKSFEEANEGEKNVAKSKRN
jgi:hypothetical protein